MKELGELRAKASLAAEIGKALLETNQSLQGEKAALRQQSETAQRRLDATSRQVTDLLQENEDLRARMTSLGAHCEQLERSNVALGRALERPSAGQQQERHKRAALEQQTARDAEKLIILLAEEEDKTAQLAQALERTRVEADRFRQQAEQLEMECERQRAEVRVLAEVRREREALEQTVGTLQRSNEELAASLLAMEHLHSKSDEWHAVSCMVLAQPWDREQLIAYAEAAQSELASAPAPQTVTAKEMTLFLQSRLPQPGRYLLAASCWKREYASKREECELLRREAARLKTELEMLENRLFNSASPATPQPSSPAPMQSLAEMLEENSELAAMREEMREANARWDEERTQLLELVRPFRSNLAELQERGQALQEARETIARLMAELDSRAPPETLARVQQLEDELAATALLAEEGRRRLAEALLDKSQLAAALRRIESTVQKEEKDDEGRRQSVGVANATTAVRLASQPRAMSVADFGAWLPPAAAAGEERKIVERVVALERRLKVGFCNVSLQWRLMVCFLGLVLSSRPLPASVSAGGKAVGAIGARVCRAAGGAGSQDGALLLAEPEREAGSGGARRGGQQERQRPVRCDAGRGVARARVALSHHGLFWLQLHLSIARQGPSASQKGAGVTMNKSAGSIAKSPRKGPGSPPPVLKAANTPEPEDRLRTGTVAIHQNKSNAAKAELAMLAAWINEGIAQPDFVCVTEATLVQRVREGGLVPLLLRSFFGDVPTVAEALGRVPAAGRAQRNAFEQVEAHNAALKACEAAGVKLVNIAGSDLAEGRTEVVLAVVVQLAREALMKRVKVRR